jgi:hypothetical protein
MKQIMSGGRRATALIVVLLLVTPVVGVAIQPVAAQESGNGGNGGNGGSTSPTDFANQVCSSSGYNMVLGIAYVIIALVFIALILGAAMGAGLISVGWLGRTFSEKAKKMLTGSVGGGILFLLTMTILGIAIANVQINLPSSCTWVLA